jgi:hypothetical protein
MNIIVFDRKTEYHALAGYAGFIYLMRSDFRRNLLLPPPNVDFIQWISVLAEIMGNYLDVRIAARGLFLSIAISLREEWMAGKQALFPTLDDVYNRLTSKSYPLMSHLARYRETLENRLLTLRLTLGESISSHRLIDWDKYMAKSWGVNLLGVPTDLQNFLITVVISQILLYRIANNLRSSKLEVLFVLDEAGPLFKRWYEQQEGTYWLSQCLTQAREFGVGFLIANQGLSDMSHSVLANTSTKILIGGAGLGEDWNRFASAVSLTPDQVEFLKRTLRPGLACVKDPRYPDPFLLDVPRIS